MTTSISHSLIIGLISVLTQAARGLQSGPVQLPAATIRSLPKGRYFVSAFRLDVKVPVSVAGSRLAEFYNLHEFMKQIISSCCGNSGARIAVCQSRAISKRGLVYDVPDFGLRKSEYRRLRPRRSPTQGRMQ